MAEQRRTARYTARRRTDAITTTLAVGATLFGLGWLALILGRRSGTASAACRRRCSRR